MTGAYDYYNTCTSITISHSGLVSSGAYGSNLNWPKETKQEKLDRLSKNTMLSSWKVYNDKTLTIKEIKQICKPKYKLFLQK